MKAESESLLLGLAFVVGLYVMVNIIYFNWADYNFLWRVFLSRFFE
ncbi:MAG: hypothetical protein HQL22_00420 [Candidatus Omnitrophica bacterium]|nr:hypothetical protein [Candidatus Omnitrophota bacterium]